VIRRALCGCDVLLVVKVNAVRGVACQLLDVLVSAGVEDRSGF
jgi:hypothetical protein